ncbi:hypothetical protein C8Q75DRAFT_781198 [Abortiporus biennis]|nr:hypothetical protein C8Q75DRAFT_781198 [Abortiporus biennis]
MATDQSGTHRRRPARARTLVEVDDVMFLIMPMILSRADVLALMHSRKSLYSVGISRLLTGFPVVISSPLKLASFCDFMLNFSSERKIFHFRQLSIALAKWSIREYHSTLRDFIRLLGNAVYLETIYFKDLDGWIGLNRDVQKMLLPLKQLTSLHLCEAGEKSFEIISHHSSTLRSLRLDQMGNVSAEIISKTLSKLSRNLHQFHISQLSGAHLEGLIFLRTESLILDTPQTLELLPLLRSFPKITSLTYYSPYVHREISEEEQFLVYSANRLSQSQMTFTHLRHLRGDPMGLFLLGLKGHVVYLDITSYEESNFAEFYAVFSQTQPSRLSMEMSIKNFRRTCSRLKRYLLNPSSPILTHLALTVKFNPSNKQTLPPVIVEFSFY